MRKLIVFTFVAALAAFSLVRGEPASGLSDSYSVTKPRVQTLKETNYLYVSTETSLGKMQPVIEQSMKDLKAAMEKNKINPSGAPVFVYHGATGQPDTPFTLDIGFPVADKVTAPENLKVRKLESPKSATVLYSGKLTDIGEVYRDLYSTLMSSADMKPASESREHYLYWEGVDSPNNVVMIQVLLK